MILLFALMSCKKEAVKVDSNFIGTWTHNKYFQSTGLTLGFQTLYIGNESQGNVTTSIGDDYETNKAFVKKDFLYFGSRVGTYDYRFFIHSYPAVSTVDFIRDQDTVEIGDWYMELEGNIYVKN